MRELCRVILQHIVDCRRSVVERSQTCTALQLVVTRVRRIALRLVFNVLTKGPEF
jgi:hypothetical protein